MAKSLRNKAKTAARARKREEGVYQVHHAARLQRLSANLLKNNPNKEAIEEGIEDTKPEAEDEMEVAKEGEDGGRFASSFTSAACWWSLRFVAGWN
jgi:hypothetical protein